VRWDNLTVDADEARRLPGYRDEAVVRRFDAPEAMNVRFYEVRARSALNRVPEASRMPFRFTINPYRGCTHSCLYCVAGETPVLVADGRTKPIAELQVGDTIYGTVRRERWRRYVRTRVLAHWSTVKDAYRITLDDGTELVASGDHRFLTWRGWKHVTGTQQGRSRRPHLTLNDNLLGTGQFATTPPDSAEYRRGYLCGLIRGDAYLGSYSWQRPGARRWDVDQFRLGLVDIEALRRAREYLTDIDVVLEKFLFQRAGAIGASRRVMAIRTCARDKVVRVRELIAWPRAGAASDEWCKGFLAGIYDAEGTHGRMIRIANKDPVIVDWTTWCLRRLGFDFVVERRSTGGVIDVRISGGLGDRLRFFHTTDPAITRKRTIEGKAMNTNGRFGVASIEPIGVRRLFDITTGTGDFIANGVVSHNCFARPSHTYLDFNAREDFEREIVVKVNLPEVLRAELARPSWKREHVALGTNTDPYQWVESRYRLMPEVWRALRDSGTPCSVLTKSPLLLRDIDLMRELVDRVGFTANLSIPTLEEKAWRATEPHTPHPRKRLEAVAELARAGIPTGVLIAPLMLGINDQPGQVEEILQLAREAGAGHVGGVALHLRGAVRDIFFDWLRAHRPDLIPRYEGLYRRGAYMPRAEQERLTARARAPGDGYLRGTNGRPEPPSAPARATVASPQETLF
jgi:DNA repair photolyase